MKSTPELEDANIVRSRIDDAKIDTVMSNSFGFGGTQRHPRVSAPVILAAQ